MKMLSWNSRDNAWPGFIFQALFYISTSGLNVFRVLDCKASRVRAEVIAHSLGFNGFFCIPTIGQYRGIILLWNPSLINITILVYHKCFIHCPVQDLIEHKNWIYTFVYAYPQKDTQKQLWTNIIDLKPRISKAWLLMGDFNNICTLSEKLGGSTTLSSTLVEFNGFINDCEVFSLDVKGIPFTWCNGHKENSVIYERLDHVVVNLN